MEITKSAVHFNVTPTYSTINSNTTIPSTDYPNVTTSSIIYSNATTASWNMTNNTDVENHVCLKILYWTLPQSHVRLWDLLILIPNILFIIYLLFNISVLLPLLRRSNRQIFTVLFFLVFTSHILSITRCVVSMSVHSSTYDIIDRAMWLIMRFFLLATELSVVTFGFFFGHLDSRTSIRRVLIVTFSLSLVYSSTQAALEFLYMNNSMHNVQDGSDEHTLFGHGGIIFWFTSSFILFMIYAVIFVLPWTPLKLKFTLPAKKSFYIYCLILSLLNLCQGIGGVFLLRNFIGGMCAVDVSTFLYFTGFPPLVYLVFLHSFFKSSRSPTLLFSYRTHSEEYVDEEDDDDLYIPTPQTTIDFVDDDLDHQLLDAVDSGTFTTTAAGSSDGYVNSINFSHNPFCPSLTNHPDLSLSTPSSAASSNRLDFPVSNNIVNKLASNENKLKTFPV